MPRTLKNFSKWWPEFQISFTLWLCGLKPLTGAPSKLPLQNSSSQPCLFEAGTLWQAAYVTTLTSQQKKHAITYILGRSNVDPAGYSLHHVG